MWLVLTLIYTVDLFWNSAIYEPHIGSVFLNNCINLKAKNVEQKNFLIAVINLHYSQIFQHVEHLFPPLQFILWVTDHLKFVQGPKL